MSRRRQHRRLPSDGSAVSEPSHCNRPPPGQLDRASPGTQGASRRTIQDLP